LQRLGEAEFRLACKDPEFIRTLRMQQYFHWLYKEALKKPLQKTISPWVVVQECAATVLVQLIRSTNMMNSLTLEIVESLDMVLDTLAAKPVVFLGDHRGLSVGDDYLWLFGNPKATASFCAIKARVQRKIRSGGSLGVMKGACVGSGAGLGLACALRIATSSSVIGMPECAYGLVPDCAAMQVISNCAPALGMYLALTGASLTGADLMLQGIATHYIQEENIERFLEEAKTSSDLKALCDKYHSAPQSSSSKIAKHMDEIREVFERSKSIEEIFEKLVEKETDFRKNTLHLLAQQCPLSLKITLKAFARCKGKPFLQCVEMGYNLNIQLMDVHSFNFRSAVDNKLVARTPKLH
jgi:enoyl-CoA hydratase